MKNGNSAKLMLVEFLSKRSSPVRLLKDMSGEEWLKLEKKYNAPIKLNEEPREHPRISMRWGGAYKDYIKGRVQWRNYT